MATKSKRGKVATKDDLARLHREMVKIAGKIIISKNHDYGVTEDPFANFHADGALGIVVRMSDKVSRLRSVAKKGEKGLKFSAESAYDTAIDNINYSVLFIAYLNRKLRRR